jgi:hypothetical protein
MKTLQLFYECWLEVTKRERYHHKWLMDETYFWAIKAQFLTVELLGFDRGKLNWALRPTAVRHWMTSQNQIVLVGSVVKQVAMIPLAIPSGEYGDTMLHPQEGEKRAPQMVQKVTCH